MSSNKYSELRSIDASLNNYRLSIQYNMDKLGFNGNFEDMGDLSEFFTERVKKATLSKKPKIDEDLIKKLTSLFENMWINEAYVKSSLENLLTSKKMDHHYFYLVYISFYYSLFTSLSIILRICEPNPIKEDSHKKKINNFNLKLINHTFIRECFFKPFSLVISGNEIKNLDISYSKSVERTNVILYDKIINDYENYCEQRTLTGYPTINEDIYTLKIAKSLMKYYIENDYKSNGISYIHYFMSKRHFLHYNASFIYDKENKYNLDELLDNIKQNMVFILNISNFITESIFIRVTDLEAFKEIYDGFDICLVECLGRSLDEDEYSHQFGNLILRAIFRGI